MRSIFVNLPVSDVAASRAFFSKLGLGFNDQFSDESTACLVIEENICAMLMTPARFADFVVGGPDRVADPRRATGALFALSAQSRAEVDTLVDTAQSAGGGEWMPAQDHGFMYGRSFTDPDGHVWEVIWMDASAAAC